LKKIKILNKHKQLTTSYLEYSPNAKKHQNNLFDVSDQKALLMMETEFR